MSQAESSPDLQAAARDVCQAIEAHASVLRDDPDNVPRVIDAGSRLRSAVLQYESVLRTATGWSNPSRHLGRLPMYSGEVVERSADDGDNSDATRVRVVATYVLSIDDEELFYNLVEGRWGERPSSAEEAVRFLFESDSWDVWQYPPARIRLADADVEVVATE